jgi:hypothetical protein
MVDPLSLHGSRWIELKNEPPPCSFLATLPRGKWDPSKALQPYPMPPQLHPRRLRSAGRIRSKKSPDGIEKRAFKLSPAPSSYGATMTPIFLRSPSVHSLSVGSVCKKVPDTFLLYDSVVLAIPRHKSLDPLFDRGRR